MLSLSMLSDFKNSNSNHVHAAESQAFAFDQLQRHLLAMRTTRGSDAELEHLRAARESLALDDFESRRSSASDNRSCWSQYSRPPSRYLPQDHSSASLPQPSPRDATSCCDEKFKPDHKMGSRRKEKASRQPRSSALDRLQKPTASSRNKLSVRHHYLTNIRTNRRPDTLFRHYVDDVMSLRC